MGKKIRQKLAKETAKIDAQMAELQKKALPKKQNKRSAPIELPAACARYPILKPAANFKSSSCSPARRARELLKYLYCSFPVPGWLIDWLVCAGEKELTSPAHERSVAMLMSLIFEIGNGRSPRNILKPYLSKAEMALFFKLRAPAELATTAYSHFVYCKARAKKLPEPVCVMLGKVTAEQRLDRREIFDFVQTFIEFCAIREVNAISVQDIWDYLSCNRLVGSFSFKGRTLASMLNLVNAWHDELNRQARILDNNRAAPDWRVIQSRVDDLKIVYRGVCGIPESWNVIDKQTSLPIEVIQLRKYAELINEGRAMHNCVASYHPYCANNRCQIFSLRIDGERKGTIEVRDRAVVQARGSCNRSLTGYPLQCLRKWMGKYRLAEEL